MKRIASSFPSLGFFFRKIKGGRGWGEGERGKDYYPLQRKKKQLSEGNRNENLKTNIILKVSLLYGEGVGGYKQFIKRDRPSGVWHSEVVSKLACSKLGSTLR